MQNDAMTGAFYKPVQEGNKLSKKINYIKNTFLILAGVFCTLLIGSFIPMPECDKVSWQSFLFIGFNIVMAIELWYWIWYPATPKTLLLFFICLTAYLLMFFFNSEVRLIKQQDRCLDVLICAEGTTLKNCLGINDICQINEKTCLQMQGKWSAQKAECDLRRFLPVAGI